MSEWRAVPLGQLLKDGSISYGVVQPGTDDQAGTPIVRVKDIRHGAIDTSEPIRVSADVSSRHARTTLQGGELLISLVGTVGETAVVPNELQGWNVARAVAVARPTGVTSRWLRLAFQSAPVRHQIAGMVNTTVQTTLNLADLKRIAIPVPSAPIRDGITEVLGALDDKIAANSALAHTIDNYLESVFRQLTTIATQNEAPVGAIAKVNESTVRPQTDGQLRYIDIASVGVGRHASPPLISWSEAPGRARRGVRKGDVMWSTVRPNRRSHSLNLSDDPLLVASTGLAILTPSSVSSAYLFEVAKSPDFSSQLESMAEGSAYPAVRAERFAEVIVPLLDAQHQQTFNAVADPLRLAQYSSSEENATLAATRNLLLPQLMSGKLRVKEAENKVEALV